ncbi:MULTISPECIES: hypothetical protein [unclassified Proteiniphilum]|uniref:hypothetical protein n=1 Tax=unclassified Proteiniphilum TaxID=2622718 RepID=UPI00257FD534|nr:MULTISPECIES: hypothetical protein [unclassified Proteiniphilum]
MDVIPFSQSSGESFQGEFSYYSRNYLLQFDYRIDSGGQVTEAYAGVYGKHYSDYNSKVAELYTLGSKPQFYNSWMELILKCNYYEATIGGNGTLFYYIKERLTLLAKYYPATNEYSCVVMGKENGFWDPREDLFP